MCVVSVDVQVIELCTGSLGIKRRGTKLSLQQELHNPVAIREVTNWASNLVILP